MKQNQQLVIILSEQLADVPVRVIRNKDSEEIILGINAVDTNVAYTPPEKKYVLIWRQTDYLKVSLDEIQWIEADGSYSVIHLADGCNLTLSFNLSVIHKELPEKDFIRIHRSTVINLSHVKSLMGNCLRIGDKLQTIGREYKENVLGHFIFLGVRGHKK